MHHLFCPLTAIALLAPAAGAAQPELGKTFQIEITERANFGPAENLYVITLPVEQGDKFRIEMSPVGGAAIAMRIEVYSADGKLVDSSDGRTTKVDWEMTKGVPGKKALIHVRSDALGKVNVRITKAGAPAVDLRDEEIRKLRAENAELKKKLDEQQKQIDEIKKLLNQKKS